MRKQNLNSFATAANHKDFQSPFVVTNDIKKFIPFGINHDLSTKIPDTFIPQETKWRHLLVPPVDQGNCGSCWSFAAASCLSDRINIWKNKRILTKTLSPVLPLYCNIYDNLVESTPGACYGNTVLTAILYIYFFGISIESCYPYSIENLGYFKKEQNNYLLNDLKEKSRTDLKNFENKSATCNTYTQTDTLPYSYCTSTLNVDETKLYGWPIQRYHCNYFYDVPNVEKQIQIEIQKHGPVCATFIVYQDFYDFDGQGVYIHDTKVEEEIVGGHSVEIVGWGTWQKIPFWWIKNSWGSSYGQNGYFRFLRGNDQCFLESNVLAFIPHFHIDCLNFPEVRHLNDVMQSRGIYVKDPKHFFQVIQKTIVTAKLLNNFPWKFDKDFQEYGAFLFQIYLQSGVFSFRSTANGFSYNALYHFGGLTTFDTRATESFSIYDSTTTSSNASLWTLISFLILLCCVALFFVVKKEFKTKNHYI
ncbi:MAG: hypothetical protein CMM15_10645 [Rhodospirillaceae bacterium]|nr:hypothetical protein [Rhodospirillaceae bacterium]OUX68026.1 MAG: hypothetical protein CBD38_00980 [bacterium TMED178]